MSILYSNWGGTAAYQTTQWTADRYVNPTGDLSLVRFVADPNLGAAFSTTQKVTDNWQPVDGKIFAGILLRGDDYPSAPNDTYARIPMVSPAVDPVTPGRGFLCWEFESFPFDGPPLVSMNITADTSLTNDTAIDPRTGGPWNHWVGGFASQSDPTRFNSWMGPRVIPGQVVNFDIHYVISKDSTGGVELWFNGVQQKFHDGSTSLHYPTLVDGVNNQGPHWLTLCSYSGLGPGGTPFTHPATVVYGSPIFGTTLADVQPSAPIQHAYRLHSANRTDTNYTNIDTALADAKTILLNSGKAVFLTRES